MGWEEHAVDLRGVVGLKWRRMRILATRATTGKQQVRCALTTCVGVLNMALAGRAFRLLSRRQPRLGSASNLTRRALTCNVIVVTREWCSSVIAVLSHVSNVK
jgi:hypothetical protein